MTEALLSYSKAKFSIPFAFPFSYQNMKTWRNVHFKLKGVLIL